MRLMACRSIPANSASFSCVRLACNRALRIRSPMARRRARTQSGGAEGTRPPWVDHERVSVSCTVHSWIISRTLCAFEGDAQRVRSRAQAASITTTNDPFSEASQATGNGHRAPSHPAGGPVTSTRSAPHPDPNTSHPAAAPPAPATPAPSSPNRSPHASATNPAPPRRLNIRGTHQPGNRIRRHRRLQDRLRLRLPRPRRLPSQSATPAYPSPPHPTPRQLVELGPRLPADPSAHPARRPALLPPASEARRVRPLQPPEQSRLHPLVQQHCISRITQLFLRHLYLAASRRPSRTT
jgi:hypothetical protein